jgi:hypothetical protein
MSAPRCTTGGCDREAECVLAVELTSVLSRFVAPYCAQHGKEIIGEGRALYAAGPALSAACQPIEGVRR